MRYITKAEKVWSIWFLSMVNVAKLWEKYVCILKDFPIISKKQGVWILKKRKRIKKATDDWNSTNILAAIALNSHISTRQLKRGISGWSVLQILHSNKSLPYLTSSRVGNDFQNRVQFCEWTLQRLQEDDMSVTNILFTDEATFINNGQVNLRNMHYWSIENPHWSGHEKWTGRDLGL